jgi:hypothetical protein
MRNHSTHFWAELCEPHYFLLQSGYFTTILISPIIPFETNTYRLPETEAHMYVRTSLWRKPSVRNRSLTILPWKTPYWTVDIYYTVYFVEFSHDISSPWRVKGLFFLFTSEESWDDWPLGKDHRREQPSGTDCFRVSQATKSINANQPSERVQQMRSALGTHLINDTFRSRGFEFSIAKIDSDVLHVQGQGSILLVRTASHLKSVKRSWLHPVTDPWSEERGGASQNSRSRESPCWPATLWCACETMYLWKPCACENHNKMGFRDFGFKKLTP